MDRQKLRALSKRSDLQGWLQALGHLLLLGTTGALTYVAFAWHQWVAFGFALFAHGTVASFLGLAVHDLGHGTVFSVVRRIA